MNFDRAYISNLEVLAPSETMLTFVNVLFVVLHAAVGKYLFDSVGEPYRLVIEEMSLEAAQNGTVLVLENLKSTESNPIPSESAPSPVAVIMMICSVGVHMLYFLVQRWSVSFRISQRFIKLKSLVSSSSRTATHVCVYPPEFKGKPEIVPLVKDTKQVGTYWFQFQRRRFSLNKTTVSVLQFPLSVPIAEFVSSNNGMTVAEVAEKQSHYGMNLVDIPIPPFYQLYLQQLMSPVPIFQLFCSALWMMDEYWRYTMFTLLSIFGFEVSTAMQRKRSLVTLKSMSGKVVVPVLAKRGGGTTSKESFEFVQVTSDQLVPGDRIKLLPNTTVVPCDCLIVSGGIAVVNEASLTGESIPQMKEPIETERTDLLDLNGGEKVHALFSGTTIVRADPDMELIVARTGSQSTQGELLRMVEFAQQDMSPDKKETMYLLLFLLVFALMAAGYVVYERLTGQGTDKLTKMKTHKLILRVIMIITSVVPPGLPLQMSLAVNTALAALTKIGVFCTEPFRVPMAGSVTHCLFDKTGTLTSDQLKCLGVDQLSGGKVGGSNSNTNKNNNSSFEMAMAVMAGCHSLIEVAAASGTEGTPSSPSCTTLVGDPIETSGLSFSKWEYGSNVARLGERTLKIHHRFHFSSSLQRMSVVVWDSACGGYLSLVKGSPEVIFDRLAGGAESSGFREAYFDKYTELANAGKRVLALAYKRLSSGGSDSSLLSNRENAESELIFCGFASFAVETRSDTPTVMNALIESAGLPCAMVTGDALLTAVHVAREIGMLRRVGNPVLVLDRAVDEERLVWTDLTSAAVVEESSKRRLFPYIPSEVAKLADQFDLVVSGDRLGDSAASVLSNASVSMSVKVFARMTPSQKELIVAALRAAKGRPLMCGDGGNDVGALKQADVGVALLAGFGAANTGSKETDDPLEDPEEQLEIDSKMKQLQERRLAALLKAEMQKKRKELTSVQQQWLQEELSRPGNAGYFAAINAVTGRMKEELVKEEKLLRSKFGSANAWEKNSGKTSGSSTDASALTSRTVVQMGDASVAAPFTSRAPSIRSVLQIIRQGRCTLLVAVQMMQILMLESLVSAYTFAAITMEGGSSTEIQLIGSSMFVMVASLAFTYAQPSKKLSKILPLKSVFSPAIFFSVIAQVVIHLGVLVYAMDWAKAGMGKQALDELYEFERIRDEKLTKAIAQSEESGSGSLFGGLDGMEMWNMFKSLPYRPNLLNTVMFLVKTSQQVAVLVVNYKGSPWMQGALENTALFLSMFLCSVGIVVCSTGYIPWLNETLELLVLPPLFRNKLLLLLALSTVGSFAIDRFIVLLFSPEIFVASTWEPIKATKLSDFTPIFKTCGYVVCGVVAAPFVLGNPIGMIAGVYAYKTYKKWKEEQDFKQLELHMQQKSLPKQSVTSS